MQSAQSLGHALYRLICRGGSPQRFQYSDRLMVAAVFGFLGFAVVSQRLLFESTIIEIGLFLFTTLSGLYIGAALLTRKVPRVRLRATQLAIFVTLAASQLILLLACLLPREPAGLRYTLAALVMLGIVLGISNSLRYALATSRSAAVLITCAFACALGAFYATLLSLLRTLFG